MSTPEFTLTPAAVAAVRDLKATNSSYGALALRLYIEGKGCDGFYYGVTFDAVADHDVRLCQDDIDMIVDRDALQFVRGSVIDWVDDERGRGFLVDNPGHRRFRGKFYKRQDWQRRLTPNDEQGSAKGH